MASSRTFECGVCCDTKNVEDSIKIASDLICKDCFDESLIPLFNAALEHEHGFPVKWGNEVLDPQDFERLLPDGFMLKWIWKVREYNISVQGRIYCRHKLNGGSECGNFLNNKISPSGANKNVVFGCMKCHAHTCTQCGESFLTSPSIHTCKDEVNHEKDPYEGMTEGRDYQLCPSCGVCVTLRDGCNHVLCTQSGCGTNFCYICGERIRPHEVETEHFRVGKPCPRWNQPSAPNASHDAFFDPADNEIEVPLMLPEWVEADTPAREAILFIERGLHWQIHDLLNRDPAHLSVRTLLFILHQIMHALQVQLAPIGPWSTERAVQERAKYLFGHDIIMRVRHALLDPTNGLGPAFRLYESRHSSFLNRLQNHIRLPAHLDRLLYSHLRWAPAPRSAYHAAVAFTKSLSTVPAADRSPRQAAHARIAVYIEIGLRNLFEVPAVRTLADLESLRMRRLPRVLEKVRKEVEGLGSEGWKGWEEGSEGIKVLMEEARAAGAEFQRREDVLMLEAWKAFEAAHP